jgi:hypothetical protein
MSDAAALRSVLPKKRSDRRTLLLIGVFVLLLAACAGGLYYNNHRQQMIREQDWTSAVATIEDARTHVAMHIDSQVGGAMLYDVEVLVKYSVNGIEREQWTTVSQRPQLLSDAQLQIFRFKKQQCIIRWNPANPDHPVAEIN